MSGKKTNEETDSPEKKRLATIKRRSQRAIFPNDISWLIDQVESLFKEKDEWEKKGEN